MSGVMSVLSLRNVGVETPVPLFRNLTFALGVGQRLGIVAVNGGGKSTLLRCLAGELEPGEGEAILRKGARLAFVEQDVPSALLRLTMVEAVATGLLPEEREDGVWRVGVALDAFETPSDLLERPLGDLSGGWRRIAMLARGLVAEPDILLLDEPTNHLDLAKIGLLEEALAERCSRMAMAIVSHDRQFLDACATHTLFLRPEVSRLYDCSYSRARELLADDDAETQARLSRDMKEAERLRQSALALRNIGINSHSDAARKKSAQMMQRVDKLEQSFAQPYKERTGQVKLSSGESRSRVILSADNAEVRKPDGALLFRVGKLRVFQGDRIAVEGPNGAGKSLFVSMLRRVAALPDGADSCVRFCPGIVVGYADQHMSQLPDRMSPFDFVMETFRLGDQRSRTLLAGAGFPVERQLCPLAQFSLGQKARLGMLALRLTAPNFYLLDEPTNHVDIPGQEKLEDEILAQNATCVFVSHDRRFVERVATRRVTISRCRLVEAGAIA